MLYRENGQFKTTYRDDQRIFPILQDRVAVWLLIAFAFVGVPCQITPLRKMEHMDPSFLVRDAKKPKIIGRQRGFLRGYSDRVSFSIGLFCTEVFRPELMTERIEQQMGIPLTEVRQFNVKGEVLIYRKNGDIGRIPLEEAMHEYQRPECRHCGDFSAELAKMIKAESEYWGPVIKSIGFKPIE